jgi:hypothetical protein
VYDARMTEPGENDCVYDEAHQIRVLEAENRKLLAASLLVALLFMVGCGPSNKDKKSTEAAQKLKADAGDKNRSRQRTTYFCPSRIVTRHRFGTASLSSSTDCTTPVKNLIPLPTIPLIVIGFRW